MILNPAPINTAATTGAGPVYAVSRISLRRRFD
jgi:hypothetical protein